MTVQPLEHDDAPLVIVVTTVDDEAAAERLARMVVERRLAACVQTSEIASVYRWEGQVTTGREWRLDCKTTRDGMNALMAALAEAHPYDEPEVVALRARASTGYAGWVAAETG